MDTSESAKVVAGTRPSLPSPSRTQESFQAKARARDGSALTHKGPFPSGSPSLNLFSKLSQQPRRGRLILPRAESHGCGCGKTSRWSLALSWVLPHTTHRPRMARVLLEVTEQGCGRAGEPRALDALPHTHSLHTTVFAFPGPPRQGVHSRREGQCLCQSKLSAHLGLVSQETPSEPRQHCRAAQEPVAQAEGPTGPSHPRVPCPPSAHLRHPGSSCPHGRRGGRAGRGPPPHLAPAP